MRAVEEETAAPASGLGAAQENKGIRPQRSARLNRLSQVQYDAGQRIATGIGELDRVLGGGIIRDSLSILAARPGAGKSTLLLQAAQKVAQQGFSVLYASGRKAKASSGEGQKGFFPGFMIGFSFYPQHQ